MAYDKTSLLITASLCLALSAAPAIATSDAPAKQSASVDQQFDDAPRTWSDLNTFLDELMKAVVRHYRQTIAAIDSAIKADNTLKEVVAEARKEPSTPVVSRPPNSSWNGGSWRFPSLRPAPTPTEPEPVEQPGPIAQVPSQPQPTPTPLPQLPVQPQPAPEPEPVVGSARLSWNIPTKRENGDNLALTEINAYEIYVTAENAGTSRTIRVDNRNQTQYTVEPLNADTYYFSMVTIDSEGMYSELSQVVSKTIQ